MAGIPTRRGVVRACAGLIEAFALMVQNAMLLMPFVLGLNFLRRTEDQRNLLVAILATGLVYSLLMLFEVRMSPQLNIMIYGYFQHYFDQMIRFGGFRPIVFLYHGLWVAFFALTVLAAAAALWRSDDGRGRMKTVAMGATGEDGELTVEPVYCLGNCALSPSVLLDGRVHGRVTPERLDALLAVGKADGEEARS